MGTLRDNEFTTQLTPLKRPKKKKCGSTLEIFQNYPVCRESQLAIGWDEAFCAHYDEFSKEDHTYVCTAEDHRIGGNSWILVLNSQSKNGPVKQREDYAEAHRIKERLYEVSGERRTKDPSQQTSTAKSDSTVLKTRMEPNELTPKLDGDGILLLPHQARLRHGGNHQTTGGRHRVGINSDFPKCNVFRLQAMAILL